MPLGQLHTAARACKAANHTLLSDHIKGWKTMDAKLQRRIQRYGWDLAATGYESLWQAQLAEAQAAMLEFASPAVGERALDIACGTGLVTFAAARAVGPRGYVLGTDLSQRMIDASECRARDLGLSNCSFLRMDAESLTVEDASFDVVLCGLGLMYVPDPDRSLREMRRVLRPRTRRPRSMGRTPKLRMVGSVCDRRCRSGERGLPVVLSSGSARHTCPFVHRCWV